MKVPAEFYLRCKSEVEQLLHSGLIDVATIDNDGNFCYGITEEGEKVKTKIIEEEKVKA